VECPCDAYLEALRLLREQLDSRYEIEEFLEKDTREAPQIHPNAPE